LNNNNKSNERSSELSELKLDGSRDCLSDVK
jgi:hypothetical protein